MSPTNLTKVTLQANNKNRTWMQILCSVSTPICHVAGGPMNGCDLCPHISCHKTPHLLTSVTLAPFAFLEHEAILNPILGLCITSSLSLEISSSKSLHDWFSHHSVLRSKGNTSKMPSKLGNLPILAFLP